MAGAQLFALEELRRIFFFYALRGDPLDPEHLRSQQLIKMLSKDCRLCSPRVLLEADIFNAFQAEVTRSEKIAPRDAKPHSELKNYISGPLPAKQLTDRKKVCAPRRPGGRLTAAPPPALHV